MSNELLIAVLSFAGTALGSIIGVLQANRLTNYRIEELEKKVNKHNNLVERMTVVEQRAKSNSHRIEKLEERDQS